MRAGEAIPCAECGGRIRRGEPITVCAGRWLHPTPDACRRPPTAGTPLGASRIAKSAVEAPAAVRPYLHVVKS